MIFRNNILRDGAAAKSDQDKNHNTGHRNNRWLALWFS